MQSFQRSDSVRDSGWDWGFDFCCPKQQIDCFTSHFVTAQHPSLAKWVLSQFPMLCHIQTKENVSLENLVRVRKDVRTEVVQKCLNAYSPCIILQTRLI